MSNSAFLSREELVLSSRISECCVSDPNQDLVAFTHKRILDGGKKSATNLFLHDTNSMKITQLTRNESGAVSNLTFCVDLPGAENALLYTKSSDSQIWALPLEGGESCKVSSFPLPVESFKVFRGTGTKIWMLLVMGVYPGCSPAETVARDAAKEGGSSGMEFDKLMVRHWDTWSCYAKRNHLFICQLQVQSDGMLFAPTENLYDLMLLWESDCPPKPFGGADEYAPSPDGTSIAMVCRRVEEEKADSKLRSQPRDFAWTTATSVYLLVIPLKLWEMERAAVLADHTFFSWNMISDPNNFATASHPTWSPDSRKIAYLSMLRAGYESDPMHIEIWDAAKGSLTNVSADIDLSFNSILWDVPPHMQPRQKSPTVPVSKGELARSHKTYGSIAAAAASAVEESDLLDSDEQLPACYEYTIYATAQYRASSRIFKLDLLEQVSNAAMSLRGAFVMSGDEGRSMPMLATTVNDFTKKKEKVLYFLESSLTTPNVLKVAALSQLRGQEPLFQAFSFEREIQAGERALQRSDQSPYFREIFNPNPQYINGDLSMPQPTQYYFASTDIDGSSLLGPQDLVHCWYMPPVNLKVQGAENKESEAAEKSVPLVLIIHGGPQGAITNAWNYRWNLAYYSSLGYGVVAVNFHGSTGFGVRYLDSIRGQWGGQPYRDCMACVDFILKMKPYLNPGKVGALGASYGGFMINWINGHDPSGKFKCLVNHDGIFGLKNLYYTTEELWFPEWEFGVPYVTNPSQASNKDSRFNSLDVNASKSCPSQYELYDPSLFVDLWRTPTLVIQGCKDYRVVETEGIAAFTALQRRGIESKLLVFPDENHWCLKAVNSLHWHDVVTKWLARFLM